MATLKDLWNSWDKTKLPMRVLNRSFVKHDYFEAYYFTSDRVLHGKNSYDTAISFQIDNTWDWELYKEPKKTKELWEWVFRLNDDGPFVTSDRWMTEGEAKDSEQYPHCLLICKHPNCLKPLIVEVDDA